MTVFIRNQKDYVVAGELAFKKMGGKLPAILQDYPTGNVLGLDYIDKESLYMTLDTNRLMTSPASRLRDLRIPVFYILTDCDKDCLLLGVTQGKIYGFYNEEPVRILDEFVLEGDPEFRKGNGLIPAVVQDANTNDVLMQAYMSRESWDITRRKGLATFWSRSREKMWLKGEEESGNYLHVKEMKKNRYGDSALLKVEPAGPACHTGETSCFFRRVRGEEYG